MGELADTKNRISEIDKARCAEREHLDRVKQELFEEIVNGGRTDLLLLNHEKIRREFNAESNRPFTKGPRQPKPRLA